MIDLELVWKVAGPIVGIFVGAYVKEWFERRPKLVGFLQHATAVPLPNTNPPIAINTHSVVLRNNGRAPAKNVRLGHSVLPAYSIAPNIDHSVVDIQGGGREIRIPLLVHSRQVVISYVYQSPLLWNQINTHLESDEGPVQVIHTLPMVPPTRVQIRILTAFVAVGAATVAYIAITVGRVFLNL